MTLIYPFDFSFQNKEEMKLLIAIVYLINQDPTSLLDFLLKKNKSININKIDSIGDFYINYIGNKQNLQIEIKLI